MTTLQQLTRSTSLNREPGTSVPRLPTIRVRLRRTRRGVAMIWFAIMVFALFAMAALIVDLGHAFIARRQMQSAVNSGALEGLRFRDSLPTGVGDSAQTNEFNRRSLASQIISAALPYYTRSINGETPTLTGGMQLPGTDYYASQTIVLDSATSVSPQLNTSNAASGDMVAGHFDTTTTSHLEYSTYDRNDFTAAADESHATTASSFLARLRRTNEGLSDDSHSSGPTAPYLFGRVAWGNPADPAALWNQRAAGIAVRTTGIADARAAMSVSVLPSGSPTYSREWAVSGVQLRVDVTFSGSVSGQSYNNLNLWTSTEAVSPWQPAWPDDASAIAANFQQTLSATLTGNVLQIAPLSGSGSPITIGNLAGPDITQNAMWFGQTTTTSSNAPTTTTTGFVPLVVSPSFLNGSSGADIIVGFAKVTVPALSGVSSGTPVQITRWTNYVAPQNSSTGFPLGTACTAAKTALAAMDHTLFEAALTFRETVLAPTSSATGIAQPMPLLAPALVRSIAVP